MSLSVNPFYSNQKSAQMQQVAYANMIYFGGSGPAPATGYVMQCADGSGSMKWAPIQSTGPSGIIPSTLNLNTITTATGGQLSIVSGYTGATSLVVSSTGIQFGNQASGNASYLNYYDQEVLNLTTEGNTKCTRIGNIVSITLPARTANGNGNAYEEYDTLSSQFCPAAQVDCPVWISVGGTPAISVISVLNSGAIRLFYSVSESTTTTSSVTRNATTISYCV